MGEEFEDLKEFEEEVWGFVKENARKRGLSFVSTALVLRRLFEDVATASVFFPGGLPAAWDLVGALNKPEIVQ